jgi:hypothetical protein
MSGIGCVKSLAVGAQMGCAQASTTSACGHVTRDFSALLVRAMTGGRFARSFARTKHAE